MNIEMKHKENACIGFIEIVLIDLKTQFPQEKFFTLISLYSLILKGSCLSSFRIYFQWSFTISKV